MTSLIIDLAASETPAANQTSIKSVALIDLGKKFISGYCVALNSNYYPASEWENSYIDYARRFRIGFEFHRKVLDKFYNRGQDISKWEILPKL